MYFIIWIIKKDVIYCIIISKLYIYIYYNVIFNSYEYK